MATNLTRNRQRDIPLPVNPPIHTQSYVVRHPRSGRTGTIVDCRSGSPHQGWTYDVRCDDGTLLQDVRDHQLEPITA